MTLVERVGEGLARRLNRRQTLKRAAVAVFGAVAAWTVEGFRGNSALADHCAVVTEGDCTCNPPEGLYCNGLDPSFCEASACSGGCYYDESYRYAGACWCSAVCLYSDGQPGYYQCCDCDCYGQLCACREFIPTGFSEEVILPEEPSDAGPPPSGETVPPPPSDDGPPLPPPGFGDDEPSVPPGFEPCFPFCD
jgi:hypothetical protein